MNQPSKGLLTGLWFFAAALALAAFAITYFRNGELAWTPLIATIVLAGIGVSSARRKSGIERPGRGPG